MCGGLHDACSERFAQGSRVGFWLLTVRLPGEEGISQLLKAAMSSENTAKGAEKDGKVGTFASGTLLNAQWNRNRLQYRRLIGLSAEGSVRVVSFLCSR
jgi:hypothetical protein